MKGAVIAAIILVAFVGAAFATTLTATPNQVGMGEFVITEGSGFEANVAVTPTTATIYEAVPQFKTGRINNNVAFSPSRSKFFSPETNNGAVSYGVNLTVDDETKTTDIGVNATYILTVTNTGNATDSFNLTYTNPDIASVVTLNKTQVTLIPLATETVSLNVTNATVGLGTFRVNVTATSQGGDSSKSDFVNTTTTVDEILYGVNLTVDNETKTTDVGENATYILTVTNTGNADESFNLTVTNQDNANVVYLNKTQVTLTPSATETVSLNVGNATVGTFRVNVTATSQGDDLSKSDFVNTTTTVVPVAVYGVDLTVDEEAETTVEGENATYILTVNNTGSVVDTFNLTVTNPDNASVVVLNKTQVTLSASATETVSLNVGNATIGTCRVNVTATSSDLSKSDTINTTTTVATYGVNLTVDAEAKTTDEGENATYILTVNNTGSVVDTFNITYTNPDNASVVVLNKTQVTLNASESENVSLIVTNDSVGMFRVNVTATSQGDSSKIAYLNTTTTVATYGVNLTVDAAAKTIVESKNVTYMLTVNNTGSIEDTFNLTYSNQDNASVVDLNRTQVTLNASESGVVALNVGNAAVGTFRVNVTVTSQGDSSKSAFVKTTTTVTSLTVRPQSVNAGDFVTIAGTGFEANKTAILSCSVSDFEIPVSDGEYKYSLEDFNLSDSNTGISLSVREVEDNMTVNITTSLGVVYTINNSSNEYGLVFDYDSTNKTATVYSTESLPVGIYKLIEVSGTAVGSATEVYANFTVNNIVMTNATGYFETIIDTHGLPPREYTITVDGVVVTLTVCRLTVTLEEDDLATIKGAGFGANELVTLSCSVSDFGIDVSDGEYEYSLEDFNLSDSNTSFSLSVREVEDNMTVKITTSSWPVRTINKTSTYNFGLVFSYDFANKAATVHSSESLPVGIYKLIEVSGTAFGSATEVYANFTVNNIVMTNATGFFETVVDTHGIPTGEYTITADGVEATLIITDTTPPRITEEVVVSGITSKEATITWKTDEPSDSVVEYGEETKAYGSTVFNETLCTTHTMKLTGLSPSTTYYYRVRSTDAANNSIISDDYTFTTESAPPDGGRRGGGGGGSSGPNDIDGDGYCNIDEIIMGSDPEDPCDPDPDCVACLALGKPTLVVPAPTPRPTATVKYLQTPTPRPTPTPSATATPTSKPLFPVLGPDKPILLIVIIIAVLVLIGTLFFLHRKFKTVDSESQNNDKIVWR